jgi:molybdopterin/thiamine biosynthesis adenylyltransferase
MSLKTLATRGCRGGREFLKVSAAGLQEWAQNRHLTPRQAVEAALQEGIFPECYERNFPCLSAAQQLRFFHARVLVAGLGGLGGALAVLLARVGVGGFLLADGDLFTASNLNRQLLATHRTLGQSKARVTARHLKDLNPALQAEAIPQFLNEGNLKGYLSRVQVVMDGLDTMKARRELATAAWEAGVPLVHGAVAGRFGQVATLLPDDAAGLDRLLNVLAVEPEASREVLAPTVTLVASLQTQEAVRLLLGQPPAYHGRLAHFDGDTGRLEIIPLE